MDSQVESLNLEIINRIQSNQPGVIVNNISIVKWIQLEIPYHLMDHKGLQWNLFIEFDSRQVTLSPTAVYAMNHSLWGWFDTPDGLKFTAKCRYTYG